MKTSTRDSLKESSIKSKAAAHSVRKTNVPAGIYHPLIDSGSRMAAQAKLQENLFGQMAQRQPAEEDELLQGKSAAQNGNRYSQHLVESINVQAKLTVSAPNDVYEQEADKVAKAVTRTASSKVQRQPEEEEELRTKLASQMQRQEVPEEEEELQMQVAKSQPATVSENLENRIKAAWGGGQPLSEFVREPMEKAFGVDFRSVRVHTDSEADALNRELSAKAFTTGQDIFFRQGTYQPNSESGKGLLAHELTHVVQQAGGTKLQVKAEEGGLGKIVSDVKRQPKEREFQINIQRTVTQGDFQNAAAIAQPVMHLVPTSPVYILVTPERLSLGTAAIKGNPGLWINNPLVAKMYTNRLAELAQEEGNKDYIRSDLVAGNTILIKEAIMRGPVPEQTQCIWHECGHVATRSTRDRKVYIWEVTRLIEAVRNHLYSPADVNRCVTGNRRTYYAIEMSPELQTLLNNWDAWYQAGADLATLQQAIFGT